MAIVLRLRAVLAGAMILGCATLTCAQPYFRKLGDLPTGEINSVPTAISADTRTVVGRSAVALEGLPNTFQAFRWTEEEGMTSLGTLPGLPGPSVATDVSADGRVIVGYAYDRAGDEWIHRPFKWTAETGMVELPLPKGVGEGSAVGISDDASVIVGSAAGAVRWNADGTIDRLGYLHAGVTAAQAVSADGSTVVGYSGSEAFRWRADTGMIGLGDLPGGFVSSGAYAVSGDGSMVVGESSSDRFWDGGPWELFTWTEQTGLVGLGMRGFLYAVSADGRTFGGDRCCSRDDNAYVWRECCGAQSVRGILFNHGVRSDLDGWDLIDVRAISPNGRTFVGIGRDPDGNVYAYIASLTDFCPGDWNKSGVTDTQDLFDFLNAFFAGDADFDRNSVTNFTDWYWFFRAWQNRFC